MIDSLASALRAANLNPDEFTTSTADERIFRGQAPAGKAVTTWMNLAKEFPTTGYWPIIAGGANDSLDIPECDPASTLASVPSGDIREVLKPLIEERLQSLTDMVPEVATAKDLDEVVKRVDASGIYSFGGRTDPEQPWPTDAEAPTQLKLRTVKQLKGKAASLLLVRVKHTYEVPAYLGFGGWNNCPPPELHVAALREWHKGYDAKPVCITGDVMECAVINRPQTEAESMNLAIDQWIFCEDIVGQGTQTIRKLAMEIWRSPNWFFWWD